MSTASLKKLPQVAAWLFLTCPVSSRETRSAGRRPGAARPAATRTRTWRGRGGRLRRCCRAWASLPTSPTVNSPEAARSQSSLSPLVSLLLDFSWLIINVASNSVNLSCLVFHHWHAPPLPPPLPHSICEHLIQRLRMTPKPACHLFSFSLLSPSVCPFCVCPPYCMETHPLTHSLTHLSHTSPLHSLTLSLTHPFIH